MKSLNVLLLFLSFTVFSCSNSNYNGQYLKSHIKSNDLIQPPTPNSFDCTEAQEEARRHYENKELKYYIFSISSISFKLVDKIKKKYNVEIISLACVADNHLVCYNEFADSIMVDSQGNTLMELYQQEKNIIGN